MGQVRSRLLRWVREFPADLGFVVSFTLLTGVVAVAPVLSETPLRFVFAIGFVAFAPGYALIAALFPEQDDSVEETAEQSGQLFRRGSGITGLERFAFSVGLSITVAPLIGYLINFTPWGIRLIPVLFGIGSVTILLAAIAAYRRWQLPVEERFRVPYRSWIGDLYAAFSRTDTRLDRVLSVLVVVSLLVLVGSVAFALTTPQPGERFTEMYLLTESENGSLVAADYPTEFIEGESKPLIVGITNREHRQTEYTMVVKLQRVRTRNNSVSVTGEQELRRFRTTLTHNETWRTTHSVTPNLTGQQLRLIYLLYQEGAPDDPSVDDAHQEVHLRINVTDG